MELIEAATLLEYHYWARDRALELGAAPPKSMDLIAYFRQRAEAPR